MLIILKPALNLRITLPTSSLRLGVLEFFELFAQKSGAHYDSLDHLTFTLVFYGMSEYTVKKEDQKAWDDLKQTAKLCFKLQKKRNPATNTFEMVVEDTKSSPTTNEDDEW